jgi:SAM-dependent methyltransferase
MRNPALWRPTKFVAAGGGLRASRDVRNVARGSRATVDLIADAYARVLRRHLRGVVLDLGCGAVPLFDFYRSCGASNVVALDWPNSAHGSTFVDAFADLTRPLPIRDRSVDTVVLTDVLEHVPTPELLIAESARSLRVGGILVIGVPFLYPIHEQPHDYHRYTEFRLRQLCEEQQLEVLELEPYGGALDVLIDIVAKLTQGVPGARSLAGALALANARVGSRVRTLTSTKFPLGYTVVAQRRHT